MLHIVLHIFQKKVNRVNKNQSPLYEEESDSTQPPSDISTQPPSDTDINNNLNRYSTDEDDDEEIFVVSLTKEEIENRDLVPDSYCPSCGALRYIKRPALQTEIHQSNSDSA
ncbi:uncharacterized protein LOC132739370 [Ruditapes philippinarum]|uniref:uncharacterized protein LOC132739370 n=1 Tax=Ruditapes philippinarum TaxID=129788 RepID=UPI00295B62DA|nr:uncharacterized protein LOC132739370 [Ruditapes philippinarum]